MGDSVRFPWIGVVLMGLCLSPWAVWAQTDAAVRELHFYYEAWQAAMRERQRAEQQWQAGLIAVSRLEEARIAEMRAEVEFRRAWENFWSQTLYPTIQDAVQHRRDSGTVELALTIAVPSLPAGLIGPSPDWPPVTLPVVRVQVRNREGLLIARPYEALVYDLRPGSPKTVTFRLTADVSEIEVWLRWGSAERSYRLRLSEDRPVRLRTETPFQEASLGTTVRFPVYIEAGNPSPATYELTVEGLPDTIEAAFVFPDTQAQVRQVTFPPGTSHRLVHLEIRLPEEAGPGWSVDQAMTFAVQAFSSPDRRVIARLPLQLLPRGRARLEVLPETLFLVVKAGGVGNLRVRVRNTGTRAATQVTLRVQGPSDWAWNWNPGKLQELSPRREEAFQVSVQSPRGGGVGDFMLTLAAEGISTGLTIKSDPIDIRIQVQPAASWALYAGVATLLGLASLVMAYLVRLARR